MKYRIVTARELEDIGFDNKVREFIDDIENNPGLIVDIKHPITDIKNMIKHPSLNGHNGSHRWMVSDDTVRSYFVEIQPLQLDEDLFRV